MNNLVEILDDIHALNSFTYDCLEHPLISLQMKRIWEKLDRIGIYRSGSKQNSCYGRLENCLFQFFVIQLLNSEKGAYERVKKRTEKFRSSLMGIDRIEALRDNSCYTL